MDKPTFRERVDSMLPDLQEAIRKEAMRLFDSGGIDTSAYEGDFQLPKICLTVALENQTHQYMPLTSSGKKAVANLRHF